jgi:hypothetical protein
MKTNQKPEVKMRIELIEIKHDMDESPDISCIGDFTDQPDEWNICRCCGEYLANCDTEHEIPRSGREYRFFKPYAGGEKAGTADYQKYGKQDYNRMEMLARGDFCYIGIYAEATVSYPINSNGDRQLETFTSGGLWGIESDSGDYIEEIETEQLANLANHLAHFGIKWEPDNTKVEIKRPD